MGTAARFAIDIAIPHGSDGFPLSTLIVNAVGAFLLGVLVARVWATAPSWLRAGLGTGLLGSFTTFSAVAVSLVSLGSAGNWRTALGYLGLTIALGFGAALLGLLLGKPIPVNPDYEQ